MTAPRRRTQGERRAETTGKLVQATIDALLAVGYRATTVKEICGRAGVSHGGLFRHYRSVLELVVAASEEVARRQITGFQAKLAALPAGERGFLVALRLLRDACRSPENTVFYELLVAARTNDELRAALEPGAARYREAIRASALRVPGVSSLEPALFEAALTGIVHLFDGETLTRVVLHGPEEEERRLALLATLLEGAAAR